MVSSAIITTTTNEVFFAMETAAFGVDHTLIGAALAARARQSKKSNPPPNKGRAWYGGTKSLPQRN